MTTATPTEKPCTKCGETKPLTDYYRYARSKDGRKSHCRPCTAEYDRHNYRRRRDERLQQRRTEFSGGHAMKQCPSCRRRLPWTMFQKDIRTTSGYRSNCRTCVAEMQRDYYAKKRRDDPAYWVRRHNLLAGAKQEPYTRESIFARDGWTCGICDDPIDRDLRAPDPKSASIDHIVPLSRGGDDTPANVQASHFGCNSAKGNRSLTEARALAA